MEMISESSVDKGDEEKMGTSGATLPFSRMLGVGTATSSTSYSQQDVLDLLGIEDRRIRLMFSNSAIERRHLILPERPPDGLPQVETQGQLLDKHRHHAVEIGAEAIMKCMDDTHADLNDIQYLCCVTTTGLLTPSLSALLCKRLNLRRDCARVDIVGMGCNGGLNGLNTVACWSRANPGKLGVMLCVEICSAAYVIDDSMQTAIVNSLFADGASAISLRANENNVGILPRIVNFSSRVILEEIDAMKFCWNDVQGKFSFSLAPGVPYVIGANVGSVIGQLLAEANLKQSDISHWIVHAGGKKVIDSIKVNLGLTAYDMRHTSGVLRDFGNMSSGSFLFSYQRLMQEDKVRIGDYGVMMTMGPGTTIETALLKW